MAYEMAATIVTLNDLERYSSVAGLFKCNPSNTYAAFYTISTDSVLARFLCTSRASCLVLSQSTRVTDRRTDRITTPKTALAYARAVKI